MSKPKVHYEIGPFGQAACGKDNVDTTKEFSEVTCKSCRKSLVYLRNRKIQRALRREQAKA